MQKPPIREGILTTGGPCAVTLSILGLSWTGIPLLVSP